MDRVAPNRREETSVGYPAVSRVIECMTKLGEGQFWANNSVKSFVSSRMTNIGPLLPIPSSLLHGVSNQVLRFASIVISHPRNTRNRIKETGNTYQEGRKEGGDE